ncbi:MAG: RNA polymerase factor sigma-54 [Oligoflexia bacterium]|nr:RNA polymerase factor sigma-54 [Oligoflexia bacterium]
MGIKISHEFKQTHALSMTPQLQQAIKMLTLTHLELSDVICNELTENPLLEEVENDFSTRDKNVSDVDYKIECLEMQNHEGEERSFSDLSQSVAPPTLGESLGNSVGDTEGGPPFSDYDGGRVSAGPVVDVIGGGGIQAKSMVTAADMEDVPNYENLLSKERTLSEHLEWQLRMDSLTEEEWKIAELILGNINEDGLLEYSFDEIIGKHTVDAMMAQRILKKIQLLDPVGCAASSIQESLLIQAQNCGEGTPEMELVLKKYFSELTDQNFLNSIKKDGISRGQGEHILSVIKELNPRPGLLISSTDVQYVIPDVYVSLIGDELVISLNDEGIPKLKISGQYKSMIEKLGVGSASASFSDSEVKAKDYIKDKLRSAFWLLKSIQNRQRTILKVTEAIVRLQSDFFYKGTGSLRPMILKDVAAEIGMHESTVSRVTINKYMHTPMGVFELKYFFNSGVGGRGGVDLAAEALKTKIKVLITTEDSTLPLTDQKIVEILAQEDIRIARRTVSKYREQLGISTSVQRKKRCIPGEVCT